MATRHAQLSDDNDDESREFERPTLTTNSPVDFPPWEKRVREQRAELEVTKIRRERESILREDREAEEARRDAEKRSREAAAREEKRAKEAEAARTAEQRRLEGLRAQGRNMCLLAPTEYQARVTRDLESFVNAQQFPASLNFYTAYQILNARVDHVLKPWHDQMAREKVAQDRERERNHKITAGILYANNCTNGWDVRDAREARAEIRQALDEEVTYEWTDADLHGLVDEILRDWDDQ